jgi:hypothetical protein
MAKWSQSFPFRLPGSARSRARVVINDRSSEPARAPVAGFTVTAAERLERLRTTDLARVCEDIQTVEGQEIIGP